MLQTYRVTVDRVLEAVRPGQVRIQMRLFEHRLAGHVDLRPRPGGSPYEAAARASMTGRHQLTEIVFTNMLADYRQRQAN